MAQKKIDDEFLALLSAYLDGELTPSQTQRVERRLAEDPQARAWLDDFKKVSHMVGSLPREQAPAAMPDMVLNELERGILLDGPEIGSHLAGRNHLIAKRLIAAAAMIALACGVGVIIFNVLFKSPGSLLDNKASREPIIALSRPADNLPTKDIELPAATPAPLAPPATTTAVESADIATLPAAPTASIACHTVHLTLNVQDFAPTVTDQLTGMLTYQGIDQVLQSQLDSNHRQYAFMCTPDQLRQLFDMIQNEHPNQTDLLVKDFGVSAHVLIPAVTEDQLLAVAALPEPKDQCVLTLSRHWGRLVPADKPSSGSTGTPSLPADSIAKESLPAWLSDVIVKAEPQVSDLRALGNVKSSDALTAPSAASPTEPKASTLPPALSANSPARVKPSADLHPAAQSPAAELPAATPANQPTHTDSLSQNSTPTIAAEPANDNYLIGVVLILSAKSPAIQNP